MSEHLPQELLVNILVRLPINSIIQCTSVCKSWYALITSSCFISSHLDYQPQHLLVRYINVDPDDEIHVECGDYTLINETYALYCDNDTLDQYAQFTDVPPKYTHYQFNIVGCCNGLFCLSDDLYCYPDIYYLWNPSIRKFVTLPEPIFTFRTHGPFDHTLGFGFDPVTNDYKVVRMVHLYGRYRVTPHVELYKLSTGVWQDITHVAPACRIYEKSGVYLDGACHWITFSRKIVLFDVQDETFWEMMLPGGLVSGSRDLFVAEESLCLANHLFDDGKTIDIWRMKEYGDPESWVKQFSVSSRITFDVSVVDEYYSMIRQVAHFMVKPIASRRNGEILWRANNGLLVSYDSAVEKIKNLGIRNANISMFRDALYVNTYKVSLVLLGKRADYFAENSGEESSNLCMTEPKDRRKILKGRTKRGMRLVFPLRIGGSRYMSRMKAKRQHKDKTEEQVPAAAAP